MIKELVDRDYEDMDMSDLEVYAKEKLGDYYDNCDDDDLNDAYVNAFGGDDDDDDCDCDSDCDNEECVSGGDGQNHTCNCDISQLMRSGCSCGGY